VGRLVYFDKKTNKQIVKQGGLSKEVWMNRDLQEYIKNHSNCVCGYIGSFERTIIRDKILEKILRSVGLKFSSVVCWITSTDGRHLMDGVGKRTTSSSFEKLCKDWSANAFLKVTVWSHPDHDGSLRSTIEIIEKLNLALLKFKKLEVREK